MMIHPLQIGSLTIPNNILYAPLAGCSDFSFRKMGAIFSPGLVFTEMTKMEALLRSDEGTFSMLNFDASMHPIGAQLYGSSPRFAGKAAKIVEDLGFDCVDLNCGCPVDKVAKDGSGSGLLRTPYLIGEIIANMTASVSIPVTVKIRAGWNKKNIVIEEVVHIAETAGAKMLTIHGRTREDDYSDPVNYEYIKRAKKAAKNIPVIGNGNIFSVEDGIKMFQETGCDGLMIARGSLGHPWISEDFRLFQEGKSISEKTTEERRSLLYQHFQTIKNFRSERKSLSDMRRVGCWYFSNIPGSRAFREAISHAKSLSEAEDLILHFQFDESLQ